MLQNFKTEVERVRQENAELKDANELLEAQNRKLTSKNK